MCFERVRTLLWSAVIAVSPFGTFVATAADVDRAALQAAIMASAERYEKAFEARDTKAIAALFTPDGEYVDSDGTVFHGRAAIEGELIATFEIRPRGTLDIQVSSIRPISDGVLTEEGTSLFEPEGDGPPSATRYAAMHLRQPDGTWLMASVRELGPANLTPHARLMALKWLVGSWREEIDRQIVETTWKWSEDGNYLIAEFTHRLSSEILLKGTHRIGWDPARKQFRSWVFEANGGTAEGWWTSEGGAWTVDLTGTGADGAPMGTSLTYQRDGADAIIVTQSRRGGGLLSLPDDSHRIVRQPPAAAGVQSAKP